MHEKKQIFCLTHAGGSAAFFDEIEEELPEFEVVKLEYSGHGSRHKEPLYSGFDELADEMYALVKKSYKGCEYALFGYSMGTISLVEVLKRIVDNQEIPLPDYVFLAAHEPKTNTEYKELSPDQCSDEWVKERTIKFGTVPEKLINNKSFWRIYLPLYRADYSIIGKYSFEDLDLKTDIPAVVFYSDTDTRHEDMLLWKDIFTGRCSYYRFEGTHFFIRDHHSEMANIIKNRMNGEITDDI